MYGQANAHEQHNGAADKQHGAFGNADTKGQKSQGRQGDAEDAVALICPDSQAGAVLGLAAERLGKGFINQVADGENRRCHQ